MKLISRITLIMTSAAGIIFIILGVCFMGMSGYMSSVVTKASQVTTDVIESVESVVSDGNIVISEAEALPNFTNGGVTGMLIVGLILLLYGIGSTVVSIMALNKLEKAKVKKDVKVFGILASIFSFVAPGVFLLRLTDDDIKDKEELEDRRR
jgi:hypothetical protein